MSPPTLRKIERGDPTVAIGTVLDAAVVMGVPLFSGDINRLADHIEDRVALLRLGWSPSTMKPGWRS